MICKKKNNNIISFPLLYSYSQKPHWKTPTWKPNSPRTSVCYRNIYFVGYLSTIFFSFESLLFWYLVRRVDELGLNNSGRVCFFRFRGISTPNSLSVLAHSQCNFEDKTPVRHVVLSRSLVTHRKPLSIGIRPSHANRTRWTALAYARDDFPRVDLTCRTVCGQRGIPRAPPCAERIRKTVII